MVMKNVMQKNLRQSIRKSITRYLAIVAIIALGAGIFVGLRTTKSDMVATGQAYMDAQQMFDLQILNPYGWTDAQLESVRQLPGVEAAEGTVMVDALACLGNSGKDNVYKIYAIPERLNQVSLQGGRMPQNSQECLIDGFHMSDSILGTRVSVSAQNEEDALKSLNIHTFTVVGYVSTPLYMDMTRGTTTLGNGSVAGFLYVPRESFQVDYYTQIDIRLSGKHTIYTPEYDRAMETAAEQIKPLVTPLVLDRYVQVKTEAERQYADGLSQYQEGYQSYIQGKSEAEEALAEAKQELLDAQKELEENRQLLEDGQKQLAEGEKTLADKKQELATGEKELNVQEREAREQMEQAKLELLENHKTVSENLALVNDGIVQIDGGLAQLNEGIAQLESGLRQLNTTLEFLQTMNSALDSAMVSAQEALDRAQELGMPESMVQELRSRLEELNSQRQEYAEQLKDMQAQKEAYDRQLADLKAQREEIQTQRQSLVETKATLESALKQINDGFDQLESQKAEAEKQLAQAREQLQSGNRQLVQAEKELAEKKLELEDGLQQLADGEKKLQEGWDAFYEGEVQTQAELQDAQNQLRDAKKQLADAAKAIGTMHEPDVFILDRNANAGYLALDSSSDIVRGVSTVFPAFFLLIAALVCITTMTRMVEEERTEIGTLKAMGYTNWEIIRKYLAYSGSAAILGCGLGVVIGSVVFPIILWEAYGILLNITPRIRLEVDWLLCAGVVLAYTAVNLLVTWYCCRRILANVPAELIRPKPPTSGKKIFLEYLPFWNRISFLNKVMLRNIFRYTQRLLMMLIGIGGCTALLLTGFGLRDSIVDIVDLQFQEITLYDMDIRFAQGRTPEQMEAFRQELEPYSQEIYFFHQSSAELSNDQATRDITLVVGDDGLSQFMDFHNQREKLPMPGPGEALISIGAARIMDISVGDTVTLRNSDMQAMELTVSGIYENYVYNYLIVDSQTYEDGWGTAAPLQVACMNVAQGQDVHLASTRVSQADGVMSVMVSQDLADQVGKMLEALDLVVITIVVCAGALAMTVLYNLTNINITERIREIATIKVLGFRAGESAAYVFKENLLLSVMGAALGLLGGKYLLSFVMSQIKVDMVWMQARLNPPSFFLAIGLTMLCALLVDFLLYFRLEKINMAEALKSVE